MVSAVRSGVGVCEVARRFGVSPAQVTFWVKRAAGRRLDRVDFADRLPGPRRSPYRVAPTVEEQILKLRRALREHSVLGEYGADAIRQAWSGPLHCPSRPTVNRVLRRHGVFDGQVRQRHAAPPRGWYLPEVAAGTAELDSFDLIEDLKLIDGPLLSVLTATSVHGSLISAWPQPGFTSRDIMLRLLERWRESGLPAYAQFDNDARFQGTHRWPHSIGWVSRLCLALGVIPVFAPPREPGFQNQVESLNGLWQSKVWGRWQHRSLAALQARSTQYVTHHRVRSAARSDTAPPRRTFPSPWQFDPRATPSGRLVFLRRTNATGHVRLLGQTWLAAHSWLHRLVRCEVDLIHHQITMHALRRRQPSDQPLLISVPYRRPSLPHEQHERELFNDH
jgi:transposase-like protein